MDKLAVVDLYPIVKSSVVLPARGYGLKKIAPFVGLKYSAANAGGAQSIVWFHQYQQNPSDTEVVSELLQYNREDCLAMKCVEEWLRNLSTKPSTKENTSHSVDITDQFLGSSVIFTGEKEKN